MAGEDQLVELAKGMKQQPVSPLLPEAPPQEVKKPDGLEGLAQEMASERDSAFRLSLTASRGAKPEAAADVYKMAQATGLPSEVVERQSDLVRQNLEDEQILNALHNAPKTRDFLAQGDNLKISKDDVASLSGLEWLMGASGGGFKEGTRTVRSSALNFESIFGPLSAEKEQELRALREADEKSASGLKNFGADGWFENAVVEASRQLPILWNTVKAGGAGAVVGAGAGAMTALIAGQLGPQAATPEEAVLVPLFTQTGARWGGGANVARAVFELEAGQAYGEFSQFRDDEGNLIEQDVAKVGALVYGGVAAGLELFSLKKVLETVPGGKKLLGQLTKERVKEAMKDKAFRATLLEFVKNSGKAITAETITEILQEGSQVFIGELAKTAAPGDFEPASAPEITQRLTDTFVATLQSMSILGTVGPGTSFVLDNMRAMKAKNAAATMDALADHVANSKVAQRTPDKYLEFIQTVKAETGLQDVYVDAGQFAQYFQSQAIDPEEMAKGLQIEDDLKQAAEAGNALRIPIEQYMTKIANTVHHEALKRSIRFQPQDMTLDEAEAFDANRAEELKRVIDDTQRELAELQEEDRLPRQLRSIRETLIQDREKGGAGLRAEDADAQVRLLLAGAKVLSKEAGETVDQWFQRVNPVLKISAAAGQAPVSEKVLTQEQAQLDSEAFNKFFEGSKVVDENGQPLVVYHGTTENFTVFKPTKSARTGFLGAEREVEAPAFFFTPNKDLAFAFARNRKEGRKDAYWKDPRVVSAYINLKNPLDLTRKNEKTVKVLRQAGFDPAKVWGYRSYDVAAQHRDAVSNMDFLAENLWEVMDRPEVVQRLQELGYDGAILVENRGARQLGVTGAQRTYAVFNPSAIKSTQNRGTFDPNNPDILLQADPVAVQDVLQPMWFSALERTIAEKMPEKATPDQIRGILKNVAGVKQEELEWLDIEGFLNDKKYPIDLIDAVKKAVELDRAIAPDGSRRLSRNDERQTPAQYRAAVKASTVANDLAKKYFPDTPAGKTVGEVEDFIRNGEKVTKAEILEYIRANNVQIQEVVKGGKTAYDLLNEGRVEEANKTKSENLTKFHAYQIPGGENYRELLLTLPLSPKAAAAQDGLSGAEASDETHPANQGIFRSSHFDEPNILAHVRFNERTDAEGKRVLFIEEVQSDWHQKGRKEGYAGEPKLNAEQKEYLDLSNRFNELNDQEQARYYALQEKYGEEDFTELDTLGKGVPDAPFKKTWQELAMKRMLRYAAENGYDKIAWTTGEQQAARYDLSKHIEAITFMKAEDGDYYHVNILPKGTRGANNLIRKDLKANELADFVGKEMAEKIVNSAKVGEWASYSGLDLKVGGEGMKGFYDQIIPAFLNKYTKKWGGRVSTTDVPVMKKSFEDFEAQHRRAYPEATDAEIRKAHARFTQNATVHSLDITPAMKESVMAGQPLFQDTGTVKGSIEFANSATVITLFKSADFSTFLHESGHLFMREMQKLVESGKASPQLQADYKALTDYVGGDISTREAQEKLARAFEAYLREGKAPSVKLTSAFQRFRDWLMRIYKEIKKLNVELTDEVRGVFDRLLASEAELAEAQRFYRSKASLLDLVNPTPEQRADLEKKRQAAEGTALDKQVAKNLRAYFDAIGGQAQLRKDAEAVVSAMPVYKLIEAATEAGGLDLDAMRRTYGKEAVDAIKKQHPGLLKRGGKALSTYAAKFEFASPDDAFTALTRAVKKKDAVKNRTADLVREKEAEIRRDLSAQERTGGEEAVHNDASLTYLLAQANILLSKLERARTIRPEQLEARLYKQTAQAYLQKKKVREATRYDLYAKAEQKFAKEALRAAEKGDFNAAYDFKVRQALNHALVQEAIRLRDEKAEIENYFKLKNLKSKLKNVENAFMEVAVDLAQTYGFIPEDSLPLKTKDAALRLKELDEVLAAQTPDFILRKERPAGFKTYRDLTYQQFREVVDTVKAVINFGNDTLKSAEAGEEQSRQAVVDASVARMQTLKDRVNSKLNQLRDESSRASGVVGLADNFVADATMVQFLSDWMDAFQFVQKGTFGPMRTLYNKVLAAETTYEDTRKAIMKDTKAAWDTLGKAVQRIHAEHGNRITVPDVPLPEDMRRTKRAYWSGDRMIALLLNTGNAGNMNAIQKGYSFTPAQIQKIASYFTEAELKAIQSIWTATDAMFPRLDATHFAIYNRHIEKVAPQPVTFTSQDGKQVKLDGGYYPLIFDHRLNDRAAQFFEEDMMKNQTQAVIRSTKPEDGATYSRVPGHSLPPLLETSVWFRHVNNVVRYTTHARILRDMNVITRDAEWSKEAKKRAGHEHYKALRSWLQYQANPGRTENESIFDWSRGVMTAVALGFKNSVGLKQRADILKGIRAIGKDDLGKGWVYVAKAYRQQNWRATVLGTSHNDSWQDIIKRSAYVRTRDGNIDREISDLRDRMKPLGMKRVTIAGKEFTARDVQDAAYFWIKMNDRAAVSVIWTAAYNKFIAENADPKQSPVEQDKAAIAYADGIIQDTQASSLKAELSAIQRGEFKGLSRGAIKLFTAFMTESLKYGNRSMQNYRAWSQGSITTKEFLHHIILEQVITPWTALMLGVAGKFGDLPEWWEFLMEPVYSYLSWIPIVRDVTGWWQHGIDKVGDTTFTGALKPIAEGLKSAGLFVIGEEEFDDMLWNVGELLQAVYKVPALNFVKDVKNAIESIEGV